MPKILIVHGAGLDMRGKVQTEVFGTMTLPQYDEHIRKYASELGLEIDIFHSNIEGEVIDRIYAAHGSGTHAVVINPGGYTTGHPALAAVIAQVDFPTIEVHISNPARRGTVSDIACGCRGTVAGLGIFGYYAALRGLKELLATK